LLDLVITGGTVIDGSGQPAYQGWVGIREDRLAAIGHATTPAPEPGAATGSLPPPGPLPAAARVLDATGLVVCPGFIDIHSHGDETLLLYPSAPSAVRQGVTTIVGGNCGFSSAPLHKHWMLSFWEYDWWHEVAPYKFYEPVLRPLEEVRTKAREKAGLYIDWHSFGEFLARVEASHPAINYVPQVGHHALRTCVMGEDFCREARPEEITAMKDLLRQCLEEGARGMSTGLDYEPGGYAGTEEIVSLASVLREYGALYSTHWRRTGVSKGTSTHPLVRGLKEAVKIGERAGIRVQISHLMPGYRLYPEPPASLVRAAAQATIDVLEEGMARGVDLAFDVIPNQDGGVIIEPYLISLLAPWLRDAGSPERLALLLAAADYRVEIREYIDAGKWYDLNPRDDPGWATHIIILRSVDASLEGRTLAAIAGPNDALEVMFDLVRRDPRIRARVDRPDPYEALQLFLAHPRAMACSDTFIFDDHWEVHHPPYYLPHPNTYGIFPRFLRHYGVAPHPTARTAGVVGRPDTASNALVQAITRITSRPAGVMNLAGRGIIREGAFADLVVFDPGVIDGAGDYLEPRRYPRGIKWVLVNGQVVVEDGLQSDIRPGRILIRK